MRCLKDHSQECFQNTPGSFTETRANTESIASDAIAAPSHVAVGVEDGATAG
jgi:hypothetical protein